MCRFGEETKLLHDFHQPFTDRSGASVLQQCTFKQEQTKIAKVQTDFEEAFFYWCLALRLLCFYFLFLTQNRFVVMLKTVFFSCWILAWSFLKQHRQATPHLLIPDYPSYYSSYQVWNNEFWKLMFLFYSSMLYFKSEFYIDFHLLLLLLLIDCEEFFFLLDWYFVKSTFSFTMKKKNSYREMAHSR